MTQRPKEQNKGVIMNFKLYHKRQDKERQRQMRN